MAFRKEENIYSFQNHYYYFVHIQKNIKHRLAKAWINLKHVLRILFRKWSNLGNIWQIYRYFLSPYTNLEITFSVGNLNIFKTNKSNGIKHLDISYDNKLMTQLLE